MLTVMNGIRVWERFYNAFCLYSAEGSAEVLINVQVLCVV